jgi:hypothetical protein
LRSFILTTYAATMVVVTSLSVEVVSMIRIKKGTTSCQPIMESKALAIDSINRFNESNQLTADEINHKTSRRMNLSIAQLPPLPKITSSF